jgi:Co/Zn/Cd efflux system component
MPPLRRSVFRLPKMDCLAEETLVRAALDGVEEVRRLAFDLPGRSLTVWHLGESAAVLERLGGLRLGALLERSDLAEEGAVSGAGAAGSDAAEARTLWTVLALNAAMFVVEMVAGWIAESTGLLADGLDMLADALVYGVALYAVGRAPTLKRRAAQLCGGLQVALALTALAEVMRRAFLGSEPAPPLMIAISALALAANVTSLWLVARHREGGVHMKATYICTANDVLANLGVIVAGALVAWTGSAIPDLVIGTTIAAVVFRGAVRILQL